MKNRGIDGIPQLCSPLYITRNLKSEKVRILEIYGKVLKQIRVRWLYFLLYSILPWKQ